MRKGAWIWDSANTRREWNYWCAFRKEFTLDTVPSQAFLRISADAEYIVWVNGEWVGQGPIRAFPTDYRYENYQIARLLREGTNSIAILGHSLGISTFRYVLADAGVVAEIEVDGQLLVATDETWKCSPQPFGEQKHFRMSCQLGWLEPPEVGLGEAWLKPGFDDKPWESPATVADNRPLSPAEIQMAQVAEVRPVRVVSSATVSPPKTNWTVALRRLLLPNHTDAGPKEISALLSFVFHVKHSGQVIFELPRDWFWVQAKAKLNGTELERTPSRRNPLEAAPALEGSVQEGSNELLLDVSGHYHDWTFTISIDDQDLKLLGPPVLLGPLDGQERKVLFSRGSAQDIANDPRAVPIACDGPYFSLRNPFIRTAHAKHVAETEQQLPNLVFGDRETQVILDLGRMTVGYWTFEVEAHENTVLTINGFESIQDHTPDFCWEMSNTLEKHLPAGHHRVRSLQRRGARYLLFQAKTCIIRHFRVIETTLKTASAGRFKCSAKRINKIHEICARTSRLCSEDTFVDCPTYEQTFWVGDARNEALINYAISGDWDFVKRCWKLAAQSLDHGKLVNSHVPSGWHTIIPAWSFLWQIACWEYFQYTGDEQFLRDIYPAIQKQTDNALDMINSDGLFEIEAWNLSDWSNMDQPPRGIITANQGWLVWALKAGAKIADSLGHTADAKSYRRAGVSIAQATNKQLWDSDRKAYLDCIHDDGRRSDTVSVQTHCVLDLADIPTAPRRQTVQEILLGTRVDQIVQPGTPFFLFFVFEYLEKIGEYKRIFEIMKEKWGLMLDKGATTCWELLPGFMPGGRWTRSHCHAWSAGPAYFLTRLLLGIVPAGTAYEKTLFRPVPLGTQSCRGAVPTTKGTIRVQWKFEKDGSFTYELGLPPGVSVELDLSGLIST